MVSTNSSPPIAMPVQVPHGHVVQQIVDESGTLRHVILSPQHPPLVPLPPHFVSSHYPCINYRSMVGFPAQTRLAEFNVVSFLKVQRMDVNTPVVI